MSHIAWQLLRKAQDITKYHVENDIGPITLFDRYVEDYDFPVRRL